MTNWLTLETAIGARLPCGAVVEKAELARVSSKARMSSEYVRCFFNRPPRDKSGLEAPGNDWHFTAEGEHVNGDFPDLIPPPPPVAQNGVMVTREMLREALARVPCPGWEDRIADALGVPPEPPKQAPWKAAYEAWQDGRMQDLPLYCAWQAAVEWCVEQIDATDYTAEPFKVTLRRRIMGETK